MLSESLADAKALAFACLDFPTLQITSPSGLVAAIYHFGECVYDRDAKATARIDDSAVAWRSLK